MQRHSSVRKLILLGSTGSIGTQTIEVVAQLNALHDAGDFPYRFEIVGLAAGRNAEVLFAQATALGVRDVALANGAGDGPIRAADGIRVRTGTHAARELIDSLDADIVLGAMVGSAGLPATLAAVRRGMDVALANKETLVAAGGLVTSEALRSGAKLLPVDSEHSAIWQCLASRSQGAGAPPIQVGADVTRIVLTASGGALRTRTADEVYHATPEQALAHPTWSMGAKVTIDSASLTNKALEVIEAHWLFGLEPERIQVLVHPQSIVHSFVEYADSSVIAQLGDPDMRTPIQVALTHPLRAQGCSRRLDWSTLSRLDFEPPDLRRWPALGLGYRVIEMGGTAGAVFNGANERAVEVFLERKIPFGKIAELSGSAMERVGVSPIRDLEDAVSADREARRFVDATIGL